MRVERGFDSAMHLKHRGRELPRQPTALQEAYAMLTGDRAYADLMERTLLNNVLASPREDGRAFYYTNTLHQRVNGTEPIPRFEDVLEAHPDVRFNIEPKTDQAVEPFIDAIRTWKR